MIQTPRQTRMAYFGLETVNDGGQDAPMTPRDARWLALVIIGVLLGCALVGTTWAMLT